MEENLDILEAFGQVVREKSIERSDLAEMVKAGLVAATKKKFGPNTRAEVTLDPSSGQMEVQIIKTVVEEAEDPSIEISLEDAQRSISDIEVGEEVTISVDFHEFGRSAVQAAKQMVIQKVREGEREKIREEYTKRVGDLLSGTVQHVERGNYIIFLNRRAEAVLLGREVSRRERFRQGETIRACLIEVRDTTKGPQLILSRTHPMFLKALFELEVPEIYQGIVEIRGIAREAGVRSKVAVVSRDPHVDPVGACVGLKGSRVQAVVNELGGERIDIVPHIEEASLFISRALSPAQVYRVILKEEERAATVVVDDDQLSLAIGKGGQNVRLASQLTGWRIDLTGKTEFSQAEAERTAALWSKVAPGAATGEGLDLASLAAKEDFALTEIPGIGPKIGERLAEAGYKTFNDIINLSREDLLRVPGVGAKTADKLIKVIEGLTEEVEVAAGPEEKSPA